MRAVVLAVASVLVVGLAGPAYGGATKDTYYGRPEGKRPPSLIIGDSMTYRAWDTYRTKGYRGEINGVSGRPCSDLLSLVAERVKNKSKLRQGVAIALGTNDAGKPCERDWYVTAIRWLKMRGAKKIVLVTPWRRGDQPNAGAVKVRAGWMRQLAAKRKGVCTAEWAWYAAATPGATTDGIHFTDAAEQVYVDKVLAALRSCR